MTGLIIVVGIILVAALATYFLTKSGKIKDVDGNGIPDVIEDKVDEVKEEVGKKVKAVKTRVKKVKEELKDVSVELSDVVSAIKGKPTKSKLNSLTKEQLVQSAKQDHGVDLDISVQKSTLVNKVYSLYNKK